MPIGREEDYFGGAPEGMPPMDMPLTHTYVSPAAAELAESGRDAKLDSIYQGVQELRGRDVGAYPMASGSAGGYGDFQANLTDSRVAYGDIPSTMAYGASVGTRTVVGGAYMGASRMMSDLGSMVRPITYTPPARVYAGYSGRVMQETSFLGDAKAMLGVGNYPRAVSPYLYGLNAAEDFGSRVGLAASGAATTTGVLAASGLAGSIGGRMFGLPGSIAGGLAGYAIAGYAADQIYQGVEARRNVQDYLGRVSDQFVTAGSSAADPRRGAGFSRAARRDVAEFVRDMDIKDPLLGTDDLMNILKGSTELGMFAGVRETGEFKKRFKSIVENLKVVTTTLGQTLEEGLKTMKDLKGVGIDQSMAGQVVLQAQTFGKVAGRTASEMVNIGLQGAEIFRGTGVQMGIGFQANIMNLAAVRSARDAQLISQEAVAQAGGEEALAQRMTGSTMSYMQSSIGRGFGAMYFQPGQGFDPRAFTQTLGSGMDMGQAALMATRNLSSPRAIIEYQANQEKFRTEQGKMFGGRGLDVAMTNEALMQAASISRWTGTDMNTSTRFVMKTVMGLSDSEVQTRLAMIQNPQEFFKNAQAGAQATRDQTMADQAINNFFLHRWTDKVGDVFKSVADTVAAPLNRLVDSVEEQSVSFYERNVLGLERFNLKDTGFQAYEENIGSRRRAVGTTLEQATRMQRSGELKGTKVDLRSQAMKGVREQIAAGFVPDQAQNLVADIVAAATGKDVAKITPQDVAAVRLEAQGDKTLSTVFETSARTEDERLKAEEAKRRDAETSYQYGLQRSAKGGYTQIKVDLTDKALADFTVTTAGEQLVDQLGGLGKDSVFAGIKTHKTSKGAAVQPDIILDTAFGGFNIGLTQGEMKELLHRSRNVSMSADQAAAMDKDGQLKDIRSDLSGRIREMGRAGELDKYRSLQDLGKAVYGSDTLSPAQQAALLLETKGTRFEKQYEADRKTAAAIQATADAMTVRQQQDLTEKMKTFGGLIAGGLEVKDATVGGFLAQAVSAKDAQTKEALLEKAAKAAQGGEDADLLMGGKWQKIEQAIRTPSAAVVKAAEHVASLQEQSQLLREVAGARLSVETVRAELATSATKVSQADQVKILDTAEKAAMGRAGFDALVAAPEFKENMQILRQTTLGSKLADNLSAYDVIQRSGSGQLNSRAERQTALEQLRVGKDQIPAILDAYEQRGTAAVEDIVSKPMRDLAGTSGAAAAGAVGGVGVAATGTAAEQYALQTSINQSVLSAFEALARQLGAIR